MADKLFEINGRRVGLGQPCLVIAEAGVNHNGSLERALRLVETAALAGADAVKFQTFQARDIVTQQAPKAAYQKRLTDEAESQYAMLQRLELSPADHEKLLAACQKRGLVFMSSAFDQNGIDLLDQLRVAAFKVPSGEITNLPYLRHMGSKGRPVILSTGMSDLGEVDLAVRTLLEAGAPGLALLHCVSAYPAPAAQVNLRAMETLRNEFGWPVGYSDHTMGIETALAAVALGASVIEKHFTLDRSLPGPDHQASAEPGELAALVDGIRKVEAALGNREKLPVASELETRDVARKSLVAARQLAAGTTLGPDDLVVKRPGTGISPVRLDEVLGKRLTRDIARDELIAWEDLA